MASSNSLFPKGNSIHRPPIFNGEGYHYWKTHMQIFIEAIYLDIWESIERGPYIATMVITINKNAVIFLIVSEKSIDHISCCVPTTPINISRMFRTIHRYASFFPPVVGKIRNGEFFCFRCLTDIMTFTYL